MHAREPCAVALGLVNELCELSHAATLAASHCCEDKVAGCLHSVLLLLLVHGDSDVYGADFDNATDKDLDDICVDLAVEIAERDARGAGHSVAWRHRHVLAQWHHGLEQLVPKAPAGRDRVDTRALVERRQLTQHTVDRSN